MKKFIRFTILAALLEAPLWAAVSPERILPLNTFAVATVPDLNKARQFFKADPLVRMWNDPTMDAFTGKIEKAFNKNVMQRIREEAPIQPGEIWNLAQGQITIALTRKAGQTSPGIIFLMDSGNKAAELDRGMLQLREVLVDNQVEHERLRIEGTDFVHIPIPRRPGSGVYLGQSKSMLIVTSTEKLATTLVKNHKNPMAKTLKDNAAFVVQHKAQFDEAWMYGWLDFSTVLEVVNDEIEKRRDPDAKPDPLMPEPQRVMEALGLTGLKSVGVSGRTDEEGSLMEMTLNVPEAARRGLFSMLAPPKKDARPPPFVSADVVSFGRLRQSAAQLWKTFVDTANEITPAAAGAMAFFQAQVQAKNPEFKLKAQLIDTMGDDFIMIEMAPRGKKIQNLLNPPRLYMINSKKPKVTLRAIMDLISMVVEAPPEEDEIEGRTLYSYHFGNFVDEKETTLHAVAVGEYVVFSQDLKAIKSYLDGPKEGAKPLAKLAGLNQAAKKVGGLDGGAFGFENSKIMARGLFTVLKKNPNLISDAFGGLPQGIDPDTGLPIGGDRFGGWLDFKLLPEFKQISKYLHYTVVGVRADKQGIRMGLFMPTPPASK
ncbi:MAG: hypothetical protein VYD34_01275 [Verrucomicrobiota bacterium]|nr:hypothetical protein [Verrucomicrobiota bacterium]MEE2813905.1 hypothetical protein [Verrucomicrobiota bacterium]